MPFVLVLKKVETRKVKRGRFQQRKKLCEVDVAPNRCSRIRRHLERAIGHECHLVTVSVTAALHRAERRKRPTTQLKMQSTLKEAEGTGFSPVVERKLLPPVSLCDKRFTTQELRISGRSSLFPVAPHHGGAAPGQILDKRQSPILCAQSAGTSIAASNFGTRLCCLFTALLAA